MITRSGTTQDVDIGVACALFVDIGLCPVAEGGIVREHGLPGDRHCLSIECIGIRR